MRRKLYLIAVVFLLCLAVQTALALRCGNLFIEPGVSTAEVLHSCGEPKLKESLGKSGGAIKERWTYGPHQGGWFYFLYFKAGILEKVESKKK